MGRLSKIRQWINRDDGKFYQAGNRSLGALEIVGLLVFIGSIALWQLHVKAGVSIFWALAAGAIGLFLTIMGGSSNDRGPHA
jgi:hypothetical protein